VSLESPGGRTKKLQIWFPPLEYFRDLKLEIAKKIKSVSQPFLWMHGMEDNFLEIDIHGQVVFNNYQGPSGTGYRIPVADHSTIPEVIGFDEYIQGIKNFIIQTAPFFANLTPLKK